MVNGRSTGRSTAFGQVHAAELVAGLNAEEAREIDLDPEYDAWTYAVADKTPAGVSVTTVHSSVGSEAAVFVEVFDEDGKSVGFF